MNQPSHIQKATEIFLRLSFLSLLIALCLAILWPFLNLVLWGIIIAVSLGPVYLKANVYLGDRPKLTATLFTLVILTVLIFPSYLFFDSTISTIRQLVLRYQEAGFTIPEPNESVKDWPLIGENIYSSWLAAHSNIASVIVKYQEQLRSFGQFILNSFVGTGLGLLQFLLSIIIAGILLATRGTKSTSHGIFKKVAGSYGDEFADITEQTIKNVMKGILGIAIVQALFALIGFSFAGVPYASIWALICMILTIIQVGPGIVITPIIIWIFYTQSVVPATLWSIYLVAVMLMDNILKPIILGQGAPVPMLVIFLGAIGGFMFDGFLGLFLGAIIISIGYKLLIAWLEQESNRYQSEQTEE